MLPICLYVAGVLLMWSNFDIVHFVFNPCSLTTWHTRGCALHIMNIVHVMIVPCCRAATGYFRIHLVRILLASLLTTYFR